MSFGIHVRITNKHWVEPRTIFNNPIECKLNTTQVHWPTTNRTSLQQQQITSAHATHPGGVNRAYYSHDDDGSPRGEACDGLHGKGRRVGDQAEVEKRPDKRCEDGEGTQALGVETFLDVLWSEMGRIG